ncbi:hypothetical protein AAMO2058_000335700 [Amorphochlora amoebiformis]
MRLSWVPRMASRVLSRRVFSSSHSASRIVPPAAHPNPGVSPSTSTVTSENKGRISSSLDSASVSVLEGVPNMGVGRTVWESGLRLIDFLEKEHRESIMGAKVLELGTGTGIVGISVASMGANVVVTDREEKLLQLVKKNIDMNQEAIIAGGGSVETKQMDWGNRETTSKVAITCGPFDYIIASDVLYSSPSHINLVETLWQCAGVDTKIIITYPSRDLEWEVRSKGGDPRPPSEKCTHKFTAHVEERFHHNIIEFYAPTEPRRGNRGYSVYVMEMRLK